MSKDPDTKLMDWPRKGSAKTSFQIKEFNDQIHLVNKMGEVYTVDPNGNLSLLALGALGYKAWKMAREKDEE